MVWNSEQIRLYTLYQECGVFHPYTCGNADCRKTDGILTATENGWLCKQCGYQQDWAHPLPPNFEELLVKELNEKT